MNDHKTSPGESLVPEQEDEVEENQEWEGKVFLLKSNNSAHTVDVMYLYFYDFKKI